MAEKKIIEYEVKYKDGDIDHVTWQAAKKMLAPPGKDIISIAKITRYGNDANGEIDREEEFLYELQEVK